MQVTSFNQKNNLDTMEIKMKIDIKHTKIDFQKETHSIKICKVKINKSLMKF
jgi:hypothetical protein